MTYNTKKPRPRAITVGIALPDQSDVETNESLAELGRLVTTLGFDVVKSITQRRPSLSGGTVLGEGKLKELAQYTGGTGIVEKKVVARKSKAARRFEEENNPEDDVEEIEEEVEEDEFEVEDDFEPAEAVIFDCELGPSQLANLQSATGVEVLDRTGVIVEIFSKHAKTREARLQVEIARLNYMAPRLRETGGGNSDRMGMSGESSFELDKRKIRDRIAELKHELADIQKEQSHGRSQRAEQNCVALVGYTNAGKSSMMRALTGSQVLVEDKLFATLDTTVRTLHPVSIPKILVSDTVGFIKKLPHDLVASFRSTLEEAKNASLLLFVVDASDATFRSQLEVTKEVLATIGVDDVPSKLILNKSDNLSPEEMKKLKREFPNAIMMSTRSAEEVAQLREHLISFFESGMIEDEIFVPYTVQKAIGTIRSSLRVLSDRYDETGTYLKVRGDKDQIEKIKKDILT